jgi:chemotaxis protein methyltransferase CheR
MLSDDDFRLLLDRLDRPWSGYRKVRKGVKKRLRRHMESLQCRTIEDCLSRIGADPAAQVECEQRIIVTISRFFRDRRLWDQLQTRILPSLAACFPNGLAAWSAGCANGEEPYSLSMIWEAAATSMPESVNLCILATDAQPSCLERAREGLYSASSLKEVPEVIKKQWFQKAPGSRRWRIDGRLSKRIRWHVHQLLEAPPQGVFHIILLRNNLLTYYRGKRLQNAFNSILDRLADGGAIILGSHEQLPPNCPPLTRDPSCPWVYWCR